MKDLLQVLLVVDKVLRDVGKALNLLDCLIPRSSDKPLYLDDHLSDVA